MKFKRRIAVEQGLKAIDVVPLFNILFLLLIFLMLGPGFIVQGGFRVDLPRAVTSNFVKSENIEILVLADNKIYLKGRAVSLAQLTAFLKQLAKRKPSILIKADRKAELGVIVQIWDLCRKQGMAAVNIATDKE